MAVSDVLKSATRILQQAYMPIDGPPDHHRLWIEDADKVAGAYVSEHRSDDDERLTPEWLLSVGFKGPTFWRNWHVLTRLDGLQLCAQFDYDKRRWKVRQQGDSVYLHPCPMTRGELRRLCKAIGMQLEERP